MLLLKLLSLPAALPPRLRPLVLPRLVMLLIPLPVPAGRPVSPLSPAGGRLLRLRRSQPLVRILMRSWTSQYPSPGELGLLRTWLSAARSPQGFPDAVIRPWHGLLACILHPLALSVGRHRPSHRPPGAVLRHQPVRFLTAVLGHQLVVGEPTGQTNRGTIHLISVVSGLSFSSKLPLFRNIS